MKEPQYKVRPSSRADPKDVFRIFLSPAQLLLHKFHPGDLCHIITLDQSSTQPAIVWPATEKIKDDVVQTSKALQILYGLKLDSRISIRRSNMDSIRRGDMGTKKADEIILCEVPRNESETALPDLDEDDRWHWSWLLKGQLVKPDVILTPGMTFDRVRRHDEESRSFWIHSINTSLDRILYRANGDTKVFVKDRDYEDAKDRNYEDLVVSGERIGGLDKQIKTLNDKVSEYGDPSVTNPSLPPLFQTAHQGGILLHGPSGTGKTLVLGKICAAGWRRVFRIKTANDWADIPRIFTDALSYQPSVIFIDNLESYAGTGDLGRSGDYGDILSEELERLKGTRTLAIGATQSLYRIDQDLRRSGRFDLEIEMPLPDSKSRAEILKVMMDLPKDEPQSALDALAVRTNGFSGEHLYEVLREALRTSKSKSEDIDSADGPALLTIIENKFNGAIQVIRPRTLQLNIPETKFSDIGGYHEVKMRIQQALSWPAKYPNQMGQAGIKPKKGIILYGPPGCSKTMIARAVATESGLNFIAVKGAELLNKYVGETELAVRELFAKASAARPSVIFFDEFDSMGTARTGPQPGGVQVLTTLLIELDGVQDLQGVFVLAATNRPEDIDSALTRPGRFSEAIYMGLPDFEARRQILQKQGPLQRSNDLDIVVLSHMTEGYTGAEIDDICQNAACISFGEYVESTERGERVEKRAVTQQDMITALSNARRPSVTPEKESEYKAWGARIQ